MYNFSFKRCISFILSIIMMFSIIFANGTVLCAFAEETKQKIYTYDTFNVEYIIENEWDGAQSVKMKITNTGDESILNWYLKYSSGGVIESLYNAVIYSNSETECILKHNGYNYEIEPNSSVEFGYILRGESLTFPNEFELCNKRVEKNPDTLSISMLLASGIKDLMLTLL